jgi:hypothetical protein
MYDPNEGDRINAENDKRAKRDQNELRELLATKAGRRYVWKIFEEGYLFVTTFTKSSQTFFNEGKRELALNKLNEVLDVDPFIFAKMCKEFRNSNE